MEELEAEAILLRGPLDELAGVEQHRSHPLAVLVGFVDEQHAWLQHTPQLGPALQSASDLDQIQTNVRAQLDPDDPMELKLNTPTVAYVLWSKPNNRMWTLPPPSASRP